jgi:hypothetical protein
MRNSDMWKETTPEHSQPAVAHVRKTFDDNLWDLTSNNACRSAISDQSRTSTEPEVFQQHFSLFARLLHKVVENTFNLLNTIASQNHLENPIDWALSQVKLMLADELLIEDRQVPSEATRVRGWIVRACDGEHEDPAPIDRESFEAWIFHRNWRAPAWLHMKPLGNSSYDSSLAWERDSVDYSQDVLAFHSEMFWLAIWGGLKGLAGTAHIRDALKPRSAATQGETQESTHPDPPKEFQSRSSEQSATPERATARGIFLCKGDYWDISYKGKTIVFKDTNGVRFLAVLLREPRKSFEAKELYALATTGNSGMVDLESPAQPLDDKAKHDLQGRYEQLKSKRESALALGNIEGVAKADEEMDELADHLSDHRDANGEQSEKARKNIGAQLVATLSKVDLTLPELAAHLRNSVRKGRFLSYQADLQWDVTPPPPRKNPPR